MKKELFINQDLRTLQRKIKNDKGAEALLQRADAGNGFPKINPPKLPPLKTSEKLLAEKASEKLLAEKASEKLLAEKQGGINLSPEAWQNIFGVINSKNNNDRLF